MNISYHKCVNCKFNVMPQDERCPNCGVLRPLESLAIREEGLNNEQILTIVGILLFISLIVFLGSSTRDFGTGVCFAFPVFIVSFIVLMPIVKRIAEAISKSYRKSSEREVAERTSPYPQSLGYKENIIQQRISELSRREQQVNSVLDRARQNTGEKWRQVRATLEASTQTLQRQYARYSAKSVEIAIVRLQNKLAPFIYDTDKLSYEQIDVHLKSIEEEQDAATTLDNQLDEHRRVLGSVPEIEELARRLAEIRESMRKLRDAFVGRQAVLALKGITPLDDALAPISPPVAAIRESEIFNTQVAITDFSASFDELESEYVRVQTEEDVAQKVDEIINRVEGES